MSHPQRDANGKVVPHDDASLTNDGGVIRRIHPTYHVLRDDNSGSARITSAAFTATKGEPDNPMSVDIEQDLVAAGLAADAMVPEGFGAVRIPIGDVRGHGMRVGSEPIPDNPYHGEVWDVKDSKSKKLLKAVDKWVRPLPGVSLK
jgi:hypothetical protein